MYVIHKQLIPKNNLIWVLKINDSDTLYSFSTLEEAEIKLNELKNSDTNGRDYKVSLKNDDGSFTDL
jgi:hypothetical protein